MRVSEPFRFVVREAFKMSRRGTLVVGYVTAGVVHTGDELELVHGEMTRRVQCRGVEMVNRQPLRHPPDLGLVVSDISPEEVSAGDVLQSCP